MVHGLELGGHLALQHDTRGSLDDGIKAVGRESRIKRFYGRSSIVTMTLNAPGEEE